MISRIKAKINSAVLTLVVLYRNMDALRKGIGASSAS